MPMHIVSRYARVSFASLAALLVWACGQSAGDSQSAADTLTRRQKDSIISELPIPGAGAVGRALDVQDRTRERAEQLDDSR